MHYKKTVARRVVAWFRRNKSRVASMLAVLSYLVGMLIGIFAEKYAGGWLLVLSAFYFSWLSMRTAPPIEPVEYARFDEDAEWVDEHKRQVELRGSVSNRGPAWMDGPWDREAVRNSTANRDGAHIDHGDVHNSVSGRVDGSVTQIGHDHR